MVPWVALVFFLLSVQIETVIGRVCEVKKIYVIEDGNSNSVFIEFVSGEYKSRFSTSFDCSDYLDVEGIVALSCEWVDESTISLSPRPPEAAAALQERLGLTMGDKIPCAISLDSLEAGEVVVQSPVMTSNGG